MSLFEKGVDPREFTMIAFGGAAGLHAVAVADETGIRRVVFPENASTLSAYGILHSDLMHDLVRSRVLNATPENLGAIGPLLENLVADARARLDADAIPESDRHIELAADMHYKGQAFELTVPLRSLQLDEAALSVLISDFHDLHRQFFSYSNPGSAVEIVSLRASAIGRLPKPAARAADARDSGQPSASERSGFPAVGGMSRCGVATTCFRAPRSRGRPSSRKPTPASFSSRDGVAGATKRPPRGEEAGMNVNVADAEITPIELEIIYNALTAAAAEMDVTIWRTSRSTIVRELLDYSTAIFDRDGWNVAQAARIPSHLNSMSYFLTEILARHIPPDRWGPDDIVISNDPYCGGQHLPDIVAYKAVFRNGRRIGFVGALCHHLDVGGSSPGSYGSSATEIFQEGLRIPPVKIVEGGKLNEPIRDIILQNVRQPDILWGDLQSQLASLHIGAASVERLAAKLGEVRFEAATRQLLDRSEAAMRAVIGRIPDGTYEFEDHVDDDGISDTPIRIHARLTVEATNSRSISPAAVRR